MNYKQACLKQKFEYFLLLPLVLLGKFFGHLWKLKYSPKYFLFFPSADIGGSPKVNADILFLLKAEKPLIIFSKKPKNNGFLELFQSAGCTILDLSRWIDNKFLHFLNVLFRGVISVWISNSKDAVVFGGECMYFYKVIPHLNSKAFVVELSHLNTWLNYNQAFIKFIDIRIASTPKLKRYFEGQYRANKIPSKYLSRLHYIDNWVEIPAYKKMNSGNLKILFVGRGAAQKRVHIISAIAETILKKRNDIDFTFVGDVEKIVSPSVLKFSNHFRFITDPEVLSKLYEDSHILILTSSYEGLPIVVMDMMARGRVVLSTAVDGIPDYITHMKTGLLIQELDDEKIICDEAVDLITKLEINRSFLEEMGKEARKLALKKFSRELFESNYRKILRLS